MPLSEGADGGGDALARGLRGAAEPPGDVVVVEVLDEAQAQRLARGLGQRRDQGLEGPVAVEDDYDAGAFESLISPLPETSRAALRLRFVDDLDYEGIATRLGCSPEAARQRVSTAVRNLRERHAA